MSQSQNVAISADNLPAGYSLSGPPMLIASLLACVAAGYIWQYGGLAQFRLYLVGLLLGVALYHAAFGFTTAWRNLVVAGRGEGVRAQMLMLALAVCLFFPALAQGELFGQAVSGFVRPLGWSVVVGAFIFGIGMQLSNGCASGNLYHLGGGQLRAIPAMLGFIAGSFWATADYEWWTTLPQLAPISLIDTLGVMLALLLNLMLFLAIALLTKKLESKLQPQAVAPSPDMPLSRRLLHGPWPFYWGAIALALLNFLTLYMIGRPWAVALAYPLWGAKAYYGLGLDQLLGLEVDFWAYWMIPDREAALVEPLVSDVATVMNVGVIMGAIAAAALANKLSLQWRLPWQHWLAATIGGLMLGYGATIAYGCNIGAFFGGIISGSLHGWLWLLAAFAGSFVGTRLRPFFKLPYDSQNN